jgi:hypothetical protein
MVFRYTLLSCDEAKLPLLHVLYCTTLFLAWQVRTRKSLELRVVHAVTDTADKHRNGRGRPVGHLHLLPSEAREPKPGEEHDDADKAVSTHVVHVAEPSLANVRRPVDDETKRLEARHNVRAHSPGAEVLVERLRVDVQLSTVLVVVRAQLIMCETVRNMNGDILSPLMADLLHITFDNHEHAHSCCPSHLTVGTNSQGSVELMMLTVSENNATCNLGLPSCL